MEALVEESHYRELSPVTTEIYRQVSGHLVRLLGADLDINTLVDEQVREYGRQRKDEGAQSGTVVKEMIALRRALGVAKEMGHFAGDPMAIVPSFKVKYVPRRRWLTEAEFRALHSTLSPKRQLWLLIAVFSGARRSEVDGLLWEHVDLSQGWIYLPGTKTLRSKRTIPLASSLREALEKAPRESANVVETWHNVLRDLRAACVRAKIPKVTPNDLRRTFASWLKQAGKESMVVARLLGHTSARMVEWVYGHLSDKEYREAVQVLPPARAADAPDAPPAAA